MSDIHVGTKSRQRHLQEILEAEFCPPLDTTLVAAIAADYDAKDLERNFDDVLEKLKESLAELAAAAVEDDVSEATGNGEADAIAICSITSDEKSSLFDPSSESSSISSSSVALAPVATTLSSTGHSLSTPIDFLRASFPNIAVARFHELLRDTKRTSNGDEMVDMESIVEQLLNEEYMRELDERGLDLDSNSNATDMEAGAWVLVEMRRPRAKSPQLPGNTFKVHAVNGNGKRKNKPKSKTIALVDVRQSQHRPLRARELTTGSRAAPDLWSQISSLSTYLSDLLPPNPPSFFAPYFHSPDHKSPAAAVRASLEALAFAKKKHKDKDKVKQSANKYAYTTALFALLDVVCSAPTYDTLDSIDRERVCEDAQLALEATNGASDVALDVVMLLHDLDMDGVGVMQMGVYHSPASVPLPASPTPSQSSPALAYSASFIDSPPFPIVEQRVNGSAKPDNDGGWQTVKPRPPKPPLVHPLAAHIPAYNPLSVSFGRSKGKGKAKRGSGNTFGMGGKGDVGELGAGRSAAPANGSGGDDTGKQIIECGRRRGEALRDASRYWQQGSVRTRGGEIALYFAEKARALQEQSKKLKLDAARRLVDNKRVDSESGVTIDLHYATVNESIQIVQEVLEEGWVRQSCPLYLVTGKGSHSVNGVSVLGPAIKRALDAEGWLVGKWEGGLVVRGRERGRT